MAKGIPALPAICFFTLLSKLEGTTVPYTLSQLLKVDAQNGVAGAASIDPSKKYPLFVTWDKHSAQGRKKAGEDDDELYSLRGCIGTFGPSHVLEKEAGNYAAIAAFNDTRFSPISQRELESLKCSVTLLDNFEKAKDPLDWTVGKHGIIVSFSLRKRNYHATFLPDVMTEQGWTKEEAISQCMRKAGLHSFDRPEDISDLEVERYTGEKSSLTYSEFLEYSKKL
ncbi:uncharacterized protein SAPINGB_P005424 [Magnusiomyces paraingens]|uniref:AMMECR1 domain-containing protein n=1 Tax=Magnusiomyces paraingens TaxID=2606893 RepID=A0A5E8BZL9_9ASCO|nr:uncharacterized protein SAPINGB_P005424 [Saprochaete ingens]VVT56937.1 unnamed protein product [Saprochaete ingens]